MSKRTPEMSETYFIKTFGCQMNVADTERMESLLSEAGLSRAESPETADVLLINGCSVREKAVHKAVSELGRYQFYKPKFGEEQNPERPQRKPPIIGLGGCVGQLEKDKIFAGAPYLDFVFGPDAIDALPEIVYRVRNGERKLLFTEFDRKDSYSTSTKVQPQKAQAFVNIMKGCDKFCTYCIVPFTRGREKSRTIAEVLDDVAGLVAQGVREITLLGQNVNSFGKGNPNTQGYTPYELHNPIGRVGPQPGEENFPQLLRALDRDPRLEKLRLIRFTSSHPLDFSDELIDCYAPPEKGGVAKLAPQLHLPVQSGSNKVLQKMGRHHKIETYIEQMERLRALRPDVGISTDIIVGFPGETEEDYQATLSLLDRVRYDSIYAFAYSVRPGTRAAKLVDDVPAAEKNRRLNALLKHQLEISLVQNQKRVGKTFEVLIEGESKSEHYKQNFKSQNSNDIRLWRGTTPCGRVVNVLTPSARPLTGMIVPVKVTGATKLALYGELESTYAEGLSGTVLPGLMTALEQEAETAPQEVSS